MTVYKSIRVVGTSPTSVSDAITGAVERAASTLDDLRWFEVKEIRGRLSEEGVQEFQAVIDVGFELHAHNGDRREAGSRLKAGTRRSRSEAAQEAAVRGERRRSDLAKGFRKKG